MKNDEIFFSIITVILNPDLDEFNMTMNSILNQEFQNFEIIIKDGGNFKNKISQLIINNPKVIYFQKKDLNIFDAMNQAISISNGKFLNFMNSGDKLYNNLVLQKVHSCYTLNSEVDFIYGHVHKPTAKTHFEIYPERINDFFIYNGMICHQCWFITKKLHLELDNYQVKHKILSDRIFFIQIFKKYKNLNYRRINCIVASYKGMGKSSDVEEITKMEKHINEELIKHFSSSKIRLFKKVKYFLQTFKNLINYRIIISIMRHIKTTKINNIK